MEKKNKIIIGIVLMLVIIGMLSGCIDNKTYIENEEEIIGVIEDVEITNGNLIIYFDRNYSSYDDNVIRPLIFREGFDLYDYAWCKLSIGDKVFLFYIEHITTYDDGGLYEFWLEYQAIEDVYEPKE